MALSVPLVTNNPKDYRRLDGLQLVSIVASLGAWSRSARHAHRMSATRVNTESGSSPPGRTS